MNFILGLCLGLLSATVSESFGHRIFGHPNAAQLKLYFRYPRFFAPFLRAYYHHYVIHHEKTFRKDVLTQFASAEDKRAIDQWIETSFPRSFAELVWRENYNLTLKGLDGILPFAIPFLTGPLIIAALFGKTAFIASLMTAFMPVLLSKFLHPFIHDPTALSSAPHLVRGLANTRYMKWVFENHYLHHLHVESNYNLLLGGDYLLGVHRRASADEKLEFRRLWKCFEASWRKSS